MNSHQDLFFVRGQFFIEDTSGGICKSIFSMQKGIKKIFIECAWLAAIAALSLLLLGNTVGKKSMDIHLHDTYYVISPWGLAGFLFIVMGWMVYCIRVLKGSCRNAIANSIFLTMGAALILLLSQGVSLVAPFAAGEWTAYPPVSAEGISSVKAGSNLLMQGIVSWLTGFQLVILLLMLLITYKWGKQRRNPL
jgi:heme/copper-type cytochrome/quinol oxidase subunit 1